MSDKIDQLFNLYDANKSGTVDAAEVGTMLRALGLNPTNGQVNQLLKKYNKDGDATSLTKEEFTLLFDERADLLPDTDVASDLEAAFKAFDKDGSGKVNRKELSIALQSRGETLSEEEISKMFTDAGFPEDHAELTFMEFYYLLMGEMPKPDGPPPEPITTGFTFSKGKIGSIQRELKGEWDEKSLAQFYEEEAYTPQLRQASALECRAMFDEGMQMVIGQPECVAWAEKVTAKELIIDTTPFPPSDNKEVRVQHLRPPGAGEDEVLPVMIYVHGGGGFSNKPEFYHHVVARQCIESNIVVFNVDYRLGPENKCPAQMNDVAGVAEYVAANAAELKIDPARIAIAGDSSGGWISAAACYELAVKRSKPDLVKLCVPICPVTSDAFTRDENPLEAVRVEGGPGEDGARHSWKWNMGLFIPDEPLPEEFDFTHMYVNRMTPEQAKSFPKTAILTSEFDNCRRMGEEFAAVLADSAVDRLVEFVVWPGIGHVIHGNFADPMHNMYFDDMKQLFEMYL